MVACLSAGLLINLETDAFENDEMTKKMDNIVSSIFFIEHFIEIETGANIIKNAISNSYF
jgi:hypothetical protein